MAGAFAVNIVQAAAVLFYEIICHKCLDGACKTAAMDTAYAMAGKDTVADCQANGYALILHVFVGIDILQILKGRIPRFL